MISTEPPATLERMTVALAEAHNQTLETRHHHGIIGTLHRSLVEHIGHILSDLQKGDPDRIRKFPYTQWLLDNGHVLRATLQEIERSLPGRYYRQPPTVLTSLGNTRREPRVAHLVSRALQIGELAVDLSQFKRFCSAYQTQAFLNIGELWALWPLSRYSDARSKSDN
jgi:hypothetical protein